MGDRPPSREEVMFEWFVGDAKDILQEATALREELTTLRQQHQEDSAAQAAALRDQHQAPPGRLPRTHKPFRRACRAGWPG